MRLISILLLLFLLIAKESFSGEFDTLTLRINFIIIQKSDGNGNLDADDSLHLDYLKQSTFRLNELYAFKKRFLPDSSCHGEHSMKDSGIRFKLNQVIEIKNDSLWDNDQDKNWSRCPNRRKWYLLDLQKQLDSLIPDSEKALNLYLTVSKTDMDKMNSEKDTIKDDFSQVACSMFPSSDTTDFSVVHHPNAYLKYLFMQQFPYEWGYATFGRGLAHELGHSLGLSHLRTCNNIMDGAGTVNRKNLTDYQVEKARKNITNTNLKKYLEK